jgi:putative ABC transport system permease protein
VNRRNARVREQLWSSLISTLLLCYPRRFRARFGADLRSQYPVPTTRWVTRAASAVRDLAAGGVGARIDDARRVCAELTLPSVDALRVDTRHVLRSMRRRPLFPLGVVSTLALAGGVNAVVFAILDTTLLRPLPYANAERLVSIGNQWKDFDHSALSVPEYLDYRSRSRTLESMTLFTATSFNLESELGGPERLLGARVTASFFDLLGIRPSLGRVFTAEEDRPRAPAVVLLSDGLWRRRFGADPHVIGKVIAFDSGRREIIGVMPPQLRLPDPETELWIPLSINVAEPGPRGNHNRQAIGRMKADVGFDQARAEMHTLAAQLQREHPEAYPAGSGWDTRVRDLREHLFGDFRTPLTLLMAAVMFVLLIACANVANLMAARATERRHELATRSALGAPWFRILQQAVVEGVTLGVAGGTAGLALASGLIDLLRFQLPGRLLVPDHLLLDVRVAGFAVGATACAGVLASLSTTPGRRLIALLTAQRGSTVADRRRMTAGISAAEVALATFLLIAGGVALRSFANLVRADPGVSIDGIATARVTALNRYASLDELAGYFDRVVASVSHTPGVRHAGLTSILPLSGDTEDRSFAIEAQTRPGEPSPNEQMRAVGGEYFQAIGIPLVAGRYFDARDTTFGERVAVISALAARKYWGDRSPIGARINFGGLMSREPWTTIVGVVGDVRHRGLASEFVPMMYVPVQQLPQRSLTIVAQLEPWRGHSAGFIADRVRSVDPLQPVFESRMMDEWFSRSVAEPRFSLVLLGLFAALAIALTAVGIYGVMTSMLARRTRELGVRLALGADRAALVRLILGHGAVIAGIGLATGLAAGLTASALLDAAFIGGRTIDPIVLGVVVTLVAGVALLACIVPARRALRVDPVTALRAE